MDDGGLTIVRGNTQAGGGFEFEVVIEDGFGTSAFQYTAADFIL